MASRRNGGRPLQYLQLHSAWLSRSASAASLCSVMSRFIPTHSRTEPVGFSIGTARVSIQRQPPLTCRMRYFSFQRSAFCHDALPLFGDTLTIVGMEHIEPTKSPPLLISLACKRTPGGRIFDNAPLGSVVQTISAEASTNA